MSADAKEAQFQTDIIDAMVAGGWVLGKPSEYNRDLALYESDCLAYVKNTQPKMWAKYEGLYPKNPERAFIAKLAAQLDKSDPQASDKHSRRFGTLGVLRHELRDRSASFKLCQFKPDHSLNPDTLTMYEGNILRVVPELVYSAYSTEAHLKQTGTQAKKWRIDLVLFLNGIPVVTMELKSTFKQSVESALRQYRTTRFAKDPATGKREPLLTFKRGALVHFAVGQNEAYMTTLLDGDDTRFLPFNKGTAEGAAGNDIPTNADGTQDLSRYATDYLWTEVLSPENLLQIIGRFIHLEIKREEEFGGRRRKKETLIFPRYHQWDLVRRLVETTRTEGTGHKYLVQHSAGSGKSNSIAWTAHQLASLHRRDENTDADVKVFDTVIIVTDRTILDDQLQDTISQFEHAEGVVGRINRKEGQGSKSEKLAGALTKGQPIVIVTIQTFPHVLKAIEDSVSLKERHYAIIADEAHSSQSGRTAGKLKAVLRSDAGEAGESENDDDEDENEPSAEDELARAVEARKASPNLSYYAFTATPKSKTLEYFGRLPDPSAPASKQNKPKPFHVYSMRQAIEENYILDVLRNYTNYRVAYNLSQKVKAPDAEVESKRARVKLNQWVKLHDYNIGQKVRVIVEHFKTNVMTLLDGKAKAMVVTGSRKEAVRYKLSFDKYVAGRAKGDSSYAELTAMVAFSGEVIFDAQDPHAAAIAGHKYTETNMNPGLKGRDMRKAFDSDDYQVMIVANKFQTGFDQPKLCAMYVDKKLGGVDCVQTLSRLNRIYPGKDETYVLDFFNDPEEVQKAFQEYYETAKIVDISDPNLVWDISEKLYAAEIFSRTEVTLFSEVFYGKSKGSAAIANVCKPAVDRWNKRRGLTLQKVEKHRAQLALTEAETTSKELIANAKDEFKASKAELDALDLFKKDLGTFSRYYEFISQIVDYESKELERLSLYARHLAPLLRDNVTDDDPIDLSSVQLTHYRLSKQRQQNLSLAEGGGKGLKGGYGLGSGKGRSKEEELLSEIIARLNELFETDNLTENDMLSYLNTIADKVGENEAVVSQLENNSPEQALLGDFAGALGDAVMDSGEAHQNLMMQVMNNKARFDTFGRLVLEVMLRNMATKKRRASSLPPPGNT